MPQLTPQIVQFDPPDEAREYIHRVGRTARGSNGKGRSLMFLQPSEVGFLKNLKEARVPLLEFDFPAKKIVNIQSQLEKLISSNYYLNKVTNVFLIQSDTQWKTDNVRQSAKDGYRSYLQVSYSFRIAWLCLGYNMGHKTCCGSKLLLRLVSRLNVC